jgi:hypothetical protein
MTKRTPRIKTIIPDKLYQSKRWRDWDEETCRQIVKDYCLTGIVTVWKHDPRLKSLVPWYRCWSLMDGKTIERLALQQIVKKVSEYIRGGGRVLVFCYGDRNRSGLVNALVVRSLTGVSGSEAYQVVKKAHKGALVNKHFVEYLEGLR